MLFLMIVPGYFTSTLDGFMSPLPQRDQSARIGCAVTMQGILRKIDIVKRAQSFCHLHGDIDLRRPHYNEDEFFATERARATKSFQLNCGSGEAVELPLRKSTSDPPS